MGSNLQADLADPIAVPAVLFGETRVEILERRGSPRMTG
jgi:hypothetical protein